MTFEAKKSSLAIKMLNHPITLGLGSAVALGTIASLDILKRSSDAPRKQGCGPLKAFGAVLSSGPRY